MPSESSMLLPFEVACRIYGVPNLADDVERAAFFAVWAYANAELEEALANARAKRVQRIDHYRPLDERIIRALNVISEWGGQTLARNVNHALTDGLG